MTGKSPEGSSDMNRREFIGGAAATGASMAGRRVMQGAAALGGVIAFETAEHIFSDLQVQAAGIPGTDTPKYKEEIEEFYKYLLQDGDHGLEFHFGLKRAGNLWKEGETKRWIVKGDKLNAILKRFPEIHKRGFVSLTVQMTKQSKDMVLVTLVLQDKDGKTNTNTIVARPKSKLGIKNEEEKEEEKKE